MNIGTMKYEGRTMKEGKNCECRISDCGWFDYSFDHSVILRQPFDKLRASAQDGAQGRPFEYAQGRHWLSVGSLPRVIIVI